MNKENFLLSTESLQQGTRQFDLAHLAARSVWHAIFDDLGDLEQTLGTKSTLVIKDFRAWCLDNIKSLDWKRHAIFYNWFINSKYSSIPVSNFLPRTMVGIANAWANEHTFFPKQTHFVILHSNCQFVFGAKRSLDIRKLAKVIRLEGSDLSRLTTSGFSWACSTSWNFSEFNSL